VSDKSTNEAAGRTSGPAAPAAAIGRGIQGFLTDRTKTAVPIDRDLFASGLVSSMFAMELIVHLEGAYAITIVGDDLKLDNFRTIERMITLVTRLQNLATAADG
jgi:methoxymalonate biosynthesis acyl carrier protein